MQIHYLKVFDTNYVWLLTVDSGLIVIDPGSSDVVANYITANKLTLCAILLTHSHWDHAAGVDNLVNLYQVPVYASETVAANACFDVSNIKHVIDGQRLLNLLPGVDIEIVFTPGHTFDGVSYLVGANNKEYLFCGDTLFAAGCGRVFTEDYNLMLNSLNKIKLLNDNIEIYPGHEYTLNNLKFAEFIEPENIDITSRIKMEAAKIKDNGITLPTNLALEKKTNPFFRVKDLSEKIAVVSGKELDNELSQFIELRKLKDNFTS